MKPPALLPPGVQTILKSLGTSEPQFPILSSPSIRLSFTSQALEVLSNHASQPMSSVMVIVYYKQSRRSKDNTLTKKEYPTLGQLGTAIDCDPIQNY